jgi:hypothetical protein
VKTAGLARNQEILDGIWRIDPAPSDTESSSPLTEEAWHDFRVPGQWLQQGFDVPQDKPVAVAREFTIPKEWAGYRIFLRFDAIHAGTHYWLNGKELGYSENLFTPVEWEITDAARPGRTNRLNLKMTVMTASEGLSHSSSYAGHNLGGIDRSVRLYALPKLHVSSLQLVTDLDEAYRDAELQITLGLDNPDGAQSGLTVSLRLYDAEGKTVEHSTPDLALQPLEPGSSIVSIKSRVPNPLKWNTEQPNLYKLVLELKREGRLLERVERNIGFRKIEIKGRQLYVNGARVKLAGVCRHEIDPLTGRADTMRHAEEDVKLFKSGNLNHARTSHYPCTENFLEAADRLGFYVEAEAPFCWVGLKGLAQDEAAERDPEQERVGIEKVLTPTSAMIDYFHAHPSIIIWSLANESHWSKAFDLANKLCKQLDPTRPTTFSGPLPHDHQVDPFPIPENCDILNRHYLHMPYDEMLPDDPRPFLHGECFFEVYHEKTDVTINPGLRELWAHGNVEPDSEWGRRCAESFVERVLRPGVPPGAWSHICASERLIGSEIWSGVDDINFLPDGKRISCEHGNAFWGLIDGWRRPKPELWYSKLIFSPVWFPVRRVGYTPGQALVRIPVENRYSFTDLSQLDFTWELAGAKGEVAVSLPPASKGEIEIPIPQGAVEGEALILRVRDRAGDTVNARAIRVGLHDQVALPRPRAGVPRWRDDDETVVIEGNGFSLALDRATGDFDSANPNHKAPTRYDFGDLAGFLSRPSVPYAEFPDAQTRVVEGLTMIEKAEGLEMTVTDRFEHFAGSVRWLIDKDGAGTVRFDYVYTGDDFETREMGLKVLLRPEWDEVRWRRWSEWGVFPEDHISRAEGRVKARRDKKWGETGWNEKPAWPWSLDETELGTADFRAVKFNIYEASLVAPDGSGVRVAANADVHFRACLAENGVKMHLLSRCPLAPVLLKKGDRLTGEFVVQFCPKASSR